MHGSVDDCKSFYNFYYIFKSSVCITKSIPTVLFSEAPGHDKQIGAIMHVCKALDAKAISWVELTLQEVTTGLPDTGQLQQVRRW